MCYVDVTSIFKIEWVYTVYYAPNRHTHTHTHTLRSSWCTFSGVSLVAQTVKNPPAMQAIRDQSLGQEDPLEKEMATHSKILAWKIPWTFLSSWTEEPSGLQSMGSPRVRHN